MQFIQTRPTAEEQSKILQALDSIQTWTKLIAGASNNTSWLIFIDALDAVKTHPRYKQLVLQRFNKALKAFKSYERTLLHSPDIQLFDTRHMPEESKKIFTAGFSKQDYYDFWCSTSNLVYEKAKPEINTIADYYTASFAKQGYQHTEILGKLFAAAACLELSIINLESFINDQCDKQSILKKYAWNNYKIFSLSDVHKTWLKAVYTLEPKLQTWEPDEDDFRLIDNQLHAINKILTDQLLIMQSFRKATKAYDELFKSKYQIRKLNSALYHEERELKQTIALAL